MSNDRTISPPVRGLADRCVSWLSTARPFEAWLNGVDDVEVTGEHGRSDDARRRLSALAAECRSRLSSGDIGSVDHPVLSQLVEWCDRQAGWTQRAATSFRTLHDAVLQACVCLEEASGLFDQARVDTHLAALAGSSHLAPGRHRGTPGHDAITRLARKHGLTVLCSELERTTHAQPPTGQAAEPADATSVEAQPVEAHELIELLMHAIADREKSGPARLTSALAGGMRHGDGSFRVESMIERLAGLFDVGTGHVVVRRSAEAASLLGPQAFFRPDDRGGTIFCGPVLTGSAAATASAEVVFALTVAHEAFPGHALHHACTAPQLRPVAPVLRDARGSEGWAMWAEGMLAAADEGTAAVVHWFRIKRLLPLAVDLTRRSRGDQAAAALLAEVQAAAPDLLRSTPSGHQMVKANRAYGEGYAETVRALGSAPRSGWHRTAGGYLRGAGMRPHRAATFARLTDSSSHREQREKQV